MKYCFLVSIILLGTAFLGSAETLNLANNSSFEHWSGNVPDNWTIEYNSSEVTPVIFQSSQAYSGVSSLGINASASQFTRIYIRQNISITEIVEYEPTVRFSGYLVEDDELYMDFRYFDTEGDFLRSTTSGSIVARENNTQDRFTQFGTRLTPDQSTAVMEVSLVLFLIEAKLLFDDLVLEFESVQSTSTTWTSSDRTDTNSTRVSVSESDSGLLKIQFAPVLLFLILSGTLQTIRRRP